MRVRDGRAITFCKVVGLEPGENVCESKEKYHLLQLMGSAGRLMMW